MNSNVYSIEQIFNQKLLHIPDYQRGYSWEKQHWSDFIDDIELLGTSKDHYFGTVVLHKHSNSKQIRDDEGTSYECFDIVDGQQRITTVVILLDALRQEMLNIEGLLTLVKGIEKKYLFTNDLNGQKLFKVKLNQDCHDYFTQNILSGKERVDGERIHSHKLLIQAKNGFRDYLNRKKVEEGANYKDWILGLHQKITNQLKISAYEVSETSDVGVIFEVMNNRGKPLTDLEKVKNYLLYTASKLDVQRHDLADKVNYTWSNIFQRLMGGHLVGPIYENQILRSHWLMAYDYDAKEWDGSNSIKHKFSLKNYHNKHKNLLTILYNYQESLDQASIAYRDIFAPAHSDAFSDLKHEPKMRQEIIRWSLKIQRMGNLATLLPMLIATRIRYAGDAEKYLSMIQACEMYVFRVYLFMDKRANTGQSNLFKCGYELYHNKISIDEALNRINSLILRYCPNKKYEEEFMIDEEENDWYSWGGLKYLLYEYEEHLATNDEVQLPWEVLAKKGLQNSIEHILPQTPDDKYWKSRFDKKLRRRYTHDIGNLCLTYHNPTYSNKPFDEKKGKPGSNFPCYSRSNLFMEKELAKYDEWTETELLERRSKIVEWAKQRWKTEECQISNNIEDEVEPDDEKNNIRTLGLSYLQEQLGEEPEFIKVSKGGQAFHGMTVWWFDISIKIIEANASDYYYMLCENVQESGIFHILRVPIEFLIANLERLDTKSREGAVRLHLGDCPPNLFIDVRTNGRTDFSQFVVKDTASEINNGELD